MRLKEGAEFVKRYVSNRINGKPLYVAIETTRDCTADCDFCEYRRSGDPRFKREPLDSYLDIITELNPLVLCYSGGEPLLRKDLEKLIREAKEIAKVPFLQLSTNGSLLTTERYDSLSEAGLDFLSISLDFANEEHDRVRGIPNLFSRIYGFLEQTQNRGGQKLD